MPDDPPALQTVRLLQLPVPLWAAAQEHHDELVREFALMAAGQELPDDDAAPVPQRLLRLMERLTSRFGGSSDAQREQLFTAAAQGTRVIDELVYRLPPAAGPALGELARLLEEVDEYCRAGEHLLTLATPDQLRLFRDWYLTQLQEQLAGGPPVPWPEHRARVLGEQARSG